MADEFSFQGDDQARKQQDQAADTSNNNDNSDKELTFEYAGRKMSREDALNKMQNADNHISTLEQEREKDRERLEAAMAKLEEQNKRVESMNEIIERLGGKSSDNADERKDPKTVNEDELAERAAERAFARMGEAEAKRTQENNRKDVASKLKEKYGDKTDEVVFKHMEELGYSREEAFDLAGKRPKAFLRMIGFEDKGANRSPSTTHSDTRNPHTEDRPTAQDASLQIVGVSSTKQRVANWDNRVKAKLKELGIDVR